MMVQKFRVLVGLLALVLITSWQSLALAQALPDADRALLNGDYDAAISAYSTAVNDPNLKCSALYGLGTTQLRAFQYVEADATFTRYLTECENSFRALVMRGEAREAGGLMAEALADYQAAIALSPGLLDSYLYERMASLDLDQSVRYLRLAAEAPRQPEAAFSLRQQLADIYLLIGSPTAALNEYNTLLAEIDAYLTTLSAVQGAEFDRRGELRAFIEYVAADIEINNGQPDAGYARLQRVISSYTETDYALPALVALVTANQQVDLLTRMRINVLNENYFPVVDVLSDYLADPASAQNAPAELFLLLGRALRGQGDLQGAVDAFARLRQQFPDDPLASTAALEQGSTYVQAGDYTGAVSIYSEIAALYPQSPEAPVALLRAAETERDHGDAERSIGLYDQLGQLYPNSEQTKQGLFEAGMFLRSIDPNRAAEFLGRANSAQALVWQGKVLRQIGNTDGAAAAWQNAQTVDPGTFYALRGCELLSGRESLVAMSLIPIPGVTDADRAEAEAWVAQTFGLQGVSANLSPELANDPILRRGLELWAVGMWEEARGEFDTLHKLHRDDPAALLQLAFYYQTIPVYRSSSYAATRLVFASNQPMFTIPVSILRLAFPIYYSDLLIPLSEEKGLDPLLVAALVRQESSFDPTVVSIANAHGLMQLIPSTAADVANQLAWPDYSIDDLFRPIVSLNFGTHYLSTMQAFQGGSEVGALLSYNAGPGSAQRWLAEAGGDLDVLHEIIDFAETQSYLDIIYVNHFIYQHLYTQGAPDCGFSSPLPQPTPTV